MYTSDQLPCSGPGVLVCGLLFVSRLSIIDGKILGSSSANASVVGLLFGPYKTVIPGSLL